MRKFAFQDKYTSKQCQSFLYQLSFSALFYRDSIIKSFAYKREFNFVPLGKRNGSDRILSNEKVNRSGLKMPPCHTVMSAEPSLNYARLAHKLSRFRALSSYIFLKKKIILWVGSFLIWFVVAHHVVKFIIGSYH